MKTKSGHIKKEDFDFITHELRNSLTIMQGNLDLINYVHKKKKINVATAKFLKNIQAELAVMSKMLINPKTIKKKKLT